MKLSTWPTFIAAPFMPPSTRTICLAVSTWRRSEATCAFSSERVRLAARVPVCLTAELAAAPPTLASRETRLLGSFWSAMVLGRRPPRPLRLP